MPASSRTSPAPVTSTTGRWTFTSPSSRAVSPQGRAGRGRQCHPLELWSRALRHHRTRLPARYHPTSGQDLIVEPPAPVPTAYRGSEARTAPYTPRWRRRRRQTAGTARRRPGRPIGSTRARLSLAGGVRLAQQTSSVATPVRLPVTCPAPSVELIRGRCAQRPVLPSPVAWRTLPRTRNQQPRRWMDSVPDLLRGSTDSASTSTSASIVSRLLAAPSAST
jgi:hypothetical protein